MSSKVAAELGGHEATMNRFSDRMLEHSRKLSAMGQHMTYQMTVPIVAELKTLADHALEFSKVENNMRGILDTRNKVMGLSTQATKEYTAAQVAAVKAAGELAYQSANNPALHGMANPLQYREAALAAAKAGYTDTDTKDPAASVRSVAAIANQAINLALSNNVDIKEAADSLIGVSQMFNAETKNKDGTPKSADETNKVFQRFADLMAFTQGNTRWDHENVMASYQRSAPYAALGGVSPETLTAMNEVMAEKFSGSVASTAGRSLFQGILTPKSQAAATAARAGVDLFRYQDRDKSFSAEGFEKFARNNNYTVDRAGAKAIFDRQEAAANGSGKEYSLIEMQNDLAKLIGRVGSSKNPVSPNQARKQATDYMSLVSTGTDALSVIIAEREARDGKGLTPGEQRKMYEPRALAALQGIITKPQEGPDYFAQDLDRMYGPGTYERAKARIKAGQRVGDLGTAKDDGAAATRAGEHMTDLQGAYQRIESGYSHMIEKLSDGHAFTQSADGIATLMDKISNVSPTTAAWGVDHCSCRCGSWPCHLDARSARYGGGRSRSQRRVRCRADRQDTSSVYAIGSHGHRV